jgi:hypothetical protein
LGMAITGNPSWCSLGANERVSSPPMALQHIDPQMGQIGQEMVRQVALFFSRVNPFFEEIRGPLITHGRWVGAGGVPPNRSMVRTRAGSRGSRLRSFPIGALA